MVYFWEASGLPYMWIAFLSVPGFRRRGGLGWALLGVGFRVQGLGCRDGRVSVWFGV